MVMQSGMDGVTSKPRIGRTLALSLPNVLTYMRILAVPAVVACLYGVSSDTAKQAHGESLDHPSTF